MNDYPDGIDYEWFAVDAVGHIAVFTTAGIGPIPSFALTARALGDALGAFVQALPIRGTATMLVPLPRPDDFLAFAARGLFAYDWADVHRPTRDHSGLYELYSQPSHPITASELPAECQSLLRQSILGSMNFSNSLRINVRELHKCHEPVA